MTALKKACSLLGVEESRVMKHRIDEIEGRLIVIVNNGVAGCPKYSISLSDIDEQPEPVSVEDELSQLKVGELRAMAKASNIDGYSRMKKADLIKALNA